MNILFLERKDRGEKKKVREEQWQEEKDEVAYLHHQTINLTLFLVRKLVTESVTLVPKNTMVQLPKIIVKAS